MDIFDTKKLRRQHVNTMRVNFGIEGIDPDTDDLAWQERYIEGTASLDDLIKYAHSFAEVCRKREEAVRYARASLFLSELSMTESAEAHARRFIRGELTLAEFIEQMPLV